MENNLIKNLLLLIFIVGISFQVSAQQKPDSLIINVGESKIIFLINKAEDLDELAKYDLNGILKDLKLKLAADSSLVDENTNKKLASDTTILAESSTKENENNDWRSKDDDDWRNSKDSKDWDTGDNSKKQKFNRHLLNFDIGINNWLSDGSFPEESDAQYSVRPWGSWYFAINSVNQTYIKNRLYLEWGPGISWYNFKFEDDRTRITKVDGVTTFIPDPDIDRDYKKSKLTASFINFSAVPMIQFGRAKTKRYSSINTWNEFPDIKIGRADGGFRFGIGGYAGFRLGSHSKVKLEGGKKDKDRDSFNLHTLRYGVRMQMGFKGTDLFFNYDLNELFNEGRGPKLNAFSFGLIL